MTVPTAGRVRRRLRRARSAHRDTTWSAVLTDVYVIAMAVAIYGALAVTAIRRHLRLPAAGSPAEAGVRGWLLVAVVLVLAGLAWRAVRDLGPLYVTSAARYWAVGAPVDRASWLRPALGWVAVVGAGCGALFGVLVMLIGGTEAGVVVAGAGLGVAVPAAAVVVQAAAVRRPVRGPAAAVRRPVRGPAAAPRPGSQAPGPRGSAGAPGRVVSAVLAGTGLAVALGVVALDSRGLAVPSPTVPSAWVAGLAVLLAAAAVGAALRRLGRLDAAALGGGAQLADAATASLVLLQPGMFSDIIELRRWRRVGSVHSGPLGPPPRVVAGRHQLRRMWTLVRADLRRQGRRPAGPAAWAGLLVVPYAVELVAPGGAAPARVVAGYLATERLCAGLRTVCRSAALRRLLGGSDEVLRAGHLLVPGVALAAWWALTLPATGGAGRVEPALAVGVLAAAYGRPPAAPPATTGRRSTRRSGSSSPLWSRSWCAAPTWWRRSRSPPSCSPDDLRGAAGRELRRCVSATPCAARPVRGPVGAPAPASPRAGGLRPGARALGSDGHGREVLTLLPGETVGTARPRPPCSSTRTATTAERLRATARAGDPVYVRMVERGVDRSLDTAVAELATFRA